MARLFRFSLWLAARCSAQLAERIARFVAPAFRRSDVYADTQINLAVCFPDMAEADRLQLANARMEQMILLFFELAQLRFWDKARLLDDLEVVGVDLLEEELASGDGVLLLVPHFGNWELLCAYLGEHYNVAALYDPPKMVSLEGEILAARQRFAGQMFPIGVGGMRSIIKTLRSGRLVAILPDQVPDRHAGVYVPFFGHDALTMTLPHQLLDRSRARILMGSVMRRKGGHYRLVFERLPDTGSDDARATAASINRAIEHIVGRDPKQYQWEYKRFKRPAQEGLKSIYRRQ